MPASVGRRRVVAYGSLAGQGGDSVSGPYERFRPTYDLPYDENSVRLQFNSYTGLVEGTVYDTSWFTRAWWIANAATVKTVKSSGGDYTAAQFSTALSDAATANDVRVIVVDSGLTISGSFTVPAKSGTPARTLICSSDWWSGAWTPTGQRYLDVDTEASHCAVIQGSSVSSNVMRFDTPGASDWYFVGVIIRREGSTDTQTATNLMNMNYPSATTKDGLPRNFIFQWCWIDGINQRSGTIYPSVRGIYFDGYKMAFLNSVATGFAHAGQDSQAIATIAGGGRIKLVDVLLEAASENFMTGGGGPNANFLPEDIEIRRMYSVTRQEWNPASSLYIGTKNTNSPLVKNCLEIKVVRRVLVERSILQNSWHNGQSGPGVLIKCVNQSNVDRVHDASDLTFLHVKILDVGTPITASVYENESGAGGGAYQTGMKPLNRWEFINVLGTSGTPTTVGASADRRALYIASGSGGSLYDPAESRGPFKIRWYTAVSKHSAGFAKLILMTVPQDVDSYIEDSLFDFAGQYGIDCSASGTDATGLAAAKVTLKRNALCESPTWLRRSTHSANADQYDANYWSTCSTSPSTRSAPTNWFADKAGGDYTPNSSATYLGLASGGNNPGADLAFLDSVTSGVDTAPSFITVDFV